MITLNLLSPEKQRSNAFRSTFTHAKIFLELTFVLTCLVAIVTIGTKLFLVQTILSSTTASTANVHTRELEAAVRRTNQTTSILDRLQRDTVPWSVALLRLADTMPPTITIGELTIDTKTKPHLTLKGKAATRQDLLIFKTTLEKQSWIEQLSFPLNNLLNPKDIDWQLEADMTPSSL